MLEFQNEENAHSNFNFSANMSNIFKEKMQ